jgi:hypothetical protein
MRRRGGAVTPAHEQMTGRRRAVIIAFLRRAMHGDVGRATGRGDDPFNIHRAASLVE